MTTTMTRKQTRLQRWTAMAEDAGLHLEFQHLRDCEYTEGVLAGRKTLCTAENAKQRGLRILPTGGHTLAYLRRAGKEGEALAAARFDFHQQKQTYYFPSGRKAEFYVPRNYDKRIGRAAAGGMALKKYFEAHPRG